MPKLNGRPPKYSLHKPTGQAKVTMNGRVTYLGKYRSQESYDAYDRFLDSLPKPEPRPVPTDPAAGDVVRVGDVVLKYLEFAQGFYILNGVPTGEALTCKCALSPLVNRYAHLPAVQFRPSHLEQLQRDMIARKWSRSYINKAVHIVRRCFRFAVRRDLYPGSALEDLKSVEALRAGRTEAKEPPPVLPAPDDDITAVIADVSELVADVLRVLRGTGMRVGECLGMTADQIDRSNPEEWTYRPKRHKTAYRGLNRPIPIEAGVKEIVLRRLVQAGPKDKLFPITIAAVRRAVNRSCARLGLKIFNPGQLRHTVATAVKKSDGIEAASSLLGHQHTDMTEHYAEQDLAKAREVARRIG